MLQIDKYTTPSGEQWEDAVRGIRHALLSYKKSDSDWEVGNWCDADFHLGEDDLALMSKLRKAGADHGKFMRCLPVSVEVTAPMYWWKEADTYKVGTTRLSTSTMHKIQAEEFARKHFSHEHMLPGALQILDYTIAALNSYRREYLATQSKTYWWQMIQLLPSSYNQRATLYTNYETLRNMYHQRRHHKLDEWHTFCNWIETLPYARELIYGAGGEDDA